MSEQEVEYVNNHPYLTNKLTIGACTYESDTNYVVVFGGSSKKYTSEKEVKDALDKVGFGDDLNKNQAYDEIIAFLRFTFTQTEPDDVDDFEVEGVYANSLTAEAIPWLRFYEIDKKSHTQIPVVQTNPTCKLMTKINCAKEAEKFEVGKILKHVMISIKRNGEIMQENCLYYYDKKFKQVFRECIEEVIEGAPIEDMIYNMYKFRIKGKKDKYRIPTLVEYLTECYLGLSQSPEFNLTDKIVPLSNSKDEYCWNFINLKAVAKHESEDDSFIVRWMENLMPEYSHSYYRAWLYGLLVADFPSIASLYIHDAHGGSGKSVNLDSLVSTMETISAGSTNAFSPEVFESQFWGTTFFGIRLAYDDDCSNPRVLSFNKMHKLKASVPITNKGKDTFTGAIDARCIILSNYAPSIDTYQGNQNRRFLYIKTKEFSEEYLKDMCVLNSNGSLFKDSKGNYKFKPEAEFVKKMQEQMPAFLAKSKKYYHEIFDTMMEFPVCDEMEECITGNAESEQTTFFEEFISSNITFKNDSIVKYGTLKSLIMKDEHITPAMFPEFIKYLANVHKVPVKKLNTNNGSSNSRSKCFDGIIINGAPDSILKKGHLSDNNLEEKTTNKGSNAFKDALNRGKSIK